MGQKPIEGSNPSLSANGSRTPGVGKDQALEAMGNSACSGLPVFGLQSAPVAQLDRAPGYEPGGREFESLRARQLIKNLSLAAEGPLSNIPGRV